MFVCGLGQQG